MKLEWTPDKLIDREAERELFHGIMNFKDDTRLLTITAGGGDGKSALMRRLEYDCRYAVKAPVALIPLDQVPDPTEFGWVEFTRAQFRRKTPFDKFDRLILARAQRSNTIFETMAATTGIMNAQAATLGGTNNTYAGTIVSAGSVYNVGRPDWTGPDQDSLARKLCIEGFLDDLKTICAEQPAVLLMDAWERCSDPLRDWITDEFLDSHCFDVKRRPTKLVVVIAGRQVPPFRHMLGEERYEQLVKSISSLGEWNEDHVKEFLGLHGYRDIADDDVKVFCRKLKGGWSLQKALDMVAEWD